MGTIINYFSALAILISCLGLLGLASFSAERRTKEIGIRKVLGASMAGVVAMLSKEFTKRVIVANFPGSVSREMRLMCDEYIDLSRNKEKICFV